MLILEGLYLGDVRPGERSFKHACQYAMDLCIQQQTMVYCRQMNIKKAPMPGASDHMGGNTE